MQPKPAAAIPSAGGEASKWTLCIDDFPSAIGKIRAGPKLRGFCRIAGMIPPVLCEIKVALHRIKQFTALQAIGREEEGAPLLRRNGQGDGHQHAAKHEYESFHRLRISMS